MISGFRVLLSFGMCLGLNVMLLELLQGKKVFLVHTVHVITFSWVNINNDHCLRICGRLQLGQMLVPKISSVPSPYKAKIYAEPASPSQGRVNKLGVSHVGCLVHGCFNASIPKPNLVSMETWRDAGPRIGTELEFEVTALDADAVGVLLIRGRLERTRQVVRWRVYVSHKTHNNALCDGMSRLNLYLLCLCVPQGAGTASEG